MGDVYAADVKIEFAPGYGPLEASPVWIDITSPGFEIATVHGRGSEFEQFTPGHATIMLRDEDRTFDPLNTAGPYYGQLVPNVPIRVTATYNAVTYPVFYGFVDGWDVNLDRSNTVAYVTVKATDGFKILAQKRLPVSVYEAEVLADAPHGYWRLDAGGPVAADSSGNRYDGAYTSTGSEAGTILTFGAGSVATDAVVTAPVVVLNSDARILTYPQTFEVWLEADDDTLYAPPASFEHTFTIFDQGDSDSANRMRVKYTITSAGVYEVAAGPGAWVLSDPLHVGRKHLVVVMDTSTTARLFINNTEITETATPGGSNVTTPALYFGETYAVTFASGILEASWIGRMSHVAYYDTALTEARIEAHYLAGTNPWDGDTTGERIARIADLVGWPAGLRDIDGGEVVLGPADFDGLSALAYMQLLFASEQGRGFMGQDGSIVFQDAQAVAADTTATATFTDDGTDNKYMAGSLRFTQDDRNIYNEASVQRKYGTPQTAEDATSIAAYGPRTWSVSGLLMKSDRLARSLAERKVFRYKDPQVRAEGWTVNPQVSPTTWGTHLGLEIGVHVELEVKPVDTGARETLQLDLERIASTITPAKYELTFIGSPRDPNIGTYFTWGGSDGAVTGWAAGVWR